LPGRRDLGGEPIKKCVDKEVKCEYPHQSAKKVMKNGLEMPLKKIEN